MRDNETQSGYDLQGTSPTTYSSYSLQISLAIALFQEKSLYQNFSQAIKEKVNIFFHNLQDLDCFQLKTIHMPKRHFGVRSFPPLHQSLSVPQVHERGKMFNYVWMKLKCKSFMNGHTMDLTTKSWDSLLTPGLGGPI